MLWVGGGSLNTAFVVYALTMHIIAGILLIGILAAIAHFMGWVDVEAPLWNHNPKNESSLLNR